MNFDLLIYLISLVIMGSQGIVASFSSLPSMHLVFTRTVIGSIVLLIVCALHKYKFKCLKNRKEAICLFLSGFSLGAGWIFLYQAYAIIGVSISTLLYYLGPMIALVLSPIIFKEKLTKAQVLGIIISFLGAVLLNGKIAGDPTKIHGIILGILSGVSYALMLIFNKNVKTASGMENTTIQIVASFILITIFLLFNGGIHIHIEGKEWFPVLWIGLINTCLACYFYYKTIPRLPISTIAIFSYLDPVSAVILSAVILGETLSIIQIIGVVLVIGGAAFSQLYKRI